MNIQGLIFFEENPFHEGADRVRPLAALCEISPSGLCLIILYVIIENYQVPSKIDIYPSEEGSFS